MFLLEVADAVDCGEGVVGVRHPDAHGVVLVSYLGAGADSGIHDVLAFSYQAPLAVLHGIAERGIESQVRVDVVDALNGLRLEERIENELDIVTLRELDHSHAAEDTGETGAVDRQQASKACSDGQEQYTILLYLSFHLRLSFLLIMAKNKVKD